MDELITIPEAMKKALRRCNNKELVLAMRAALGREARFFKKKVVEMQRQANIHNIRSLGKNVLSGVTRDKQGLYVTITNANHRTRAMHLNRAGKLKPIAYWLEVGAHRQGSYKMPAQHYMDKAKKAGFGPSQERICQEFEKQVMKRLDRMV